MKCIILLGTAAIAIPFIISMFNPEDKVGRAVSDRFLERPYFVKIPDYPKAGESSDVDGTTLDAWVKANAAHAKAYAFRVMPLDFLYLLALGGFLAGAAWTLASATPAVSSLPLWIWLVLPLAYMVADVFEDCLIMWLMTMSISPRLIDLLTVLRITKIGSNTGAISQIIVLAALGLIPK